MALQVPLFSSNGSTQGNFDLPEALFEKPGRLYLLHEVIVSLQANQRRGTSMTKTRGLVSGGGRKPWKQKGTGNARAGSIRSPLWRKGGIIFGPVPRSHRIHIDDIKKNAALLTALSEKAKAGDISVLESFQSDAPKTAKTAELFGKAGSSRRTLVIIDKKDAILSRTVRNLDWIQLLDAREVNAWSIMRAHKIIFLKAALDVLANRFPKG